MGAWKCKGLAIVGVVLLCLAGVACGGTSSSDHPVESTGGTGGGTGGSGGAGGSGGSGGPPCSITSLGDSDCQTCLVDGLRACPTLAISCASQGALLGCIQDNGCIHIGDPSPLDVSCLLANCGPELLQAHECLMDCEGYAACFP